MLNKKFILSIKIFILFFTKFYFVRKRFKIKFTDYNFENIFFEDIEFLKKIFFSDQFFNEKLNNKNYEYYTFNFLKIGRILGGAKSIKISKKHILNWNYIKKKRSSQAWADQVITKRFINLIYNYDFYAVSASNNEKKIINKILYEHYHLINLIIKNKKIEDLTIEELKAFFLGSLIFLKKINLPTSLITNLLKIQIDTNGFHKSYSPLDHTKFINNLHEIKNIFLFFNINFPPELNYQIINMTSSLISLKHEEDSIALFNGSNNFYSKQINKTINFTKDLKSKTITNSSDGIAVFADKNKKIFMDIVSPKNNNLHKNIHASTLAFEFSYRGEKIITNCGSLEKKMGKKPEYLRCSAAHSTIIINNTNITQLIEKNSYKRAPKKISLILKDNNTNTEWEASHDGYLKNFNKIIKRKLIIFKNDNKILGKDSILNTRISSKIDTYTIRFHLMPNSNCVISNNKKTVFIKTNKNQSWIFKSQSPLTIEDSIYVGSGNKIEQNKQIVIQGSLKDKNVTESWVLEKS